MGYQRIKFVLFVLIAVTAAVMVAGVVAAGTGHKEFADQFLGPALLMSCYVGWAGNNWGGYCSRTHRRFTYLAVIALATLAGIAFIVGGVLILVLIPKTCSEDVTACRKKKQNAFIA